MGSVIVETPLGSLKGSEYTTNDGYTIFCFQGVPYAKPPIGDLRFKDPVPLEPWTGVRSAETASLRAGMLYLNLSDQTMNSVDPETSEDCLYLNIYTPRIPDVNLKLPVFVFIHGGGFTFGCGNKEFYGPDFIVPKDVILVSINYRLGAFGFLSFENKECPGNYGLKDQNLALKWIQRNIASFGGNPDNVTLAGESAGGASVQYQMISPRSRGLFHRAIAMSGSVLNRWAYSKHAAKSAMLLARRLGYEGRSDNEALSVLQKASMDDIVLKSAGLFQEIEDEWPGEHILGFPFVPTVEPVGAPNAFLTKTPIKAIEDGDSMDIPFITGACQSEAIFVLPSRTYSPDWNDDKVFQTMLPKEMGLTLGSEESLEASKKLKEFYFPNGTSQEGYIKSFSAIFFTYGIYKTIEAYCGDLGRKSPTYVYEFTAYRTPSQVKSMVGLDGVKGTSHADELEFLFPVMLHKSLPVLPIAADSSDAKVRDTITQLFTDFAKNGVPSPDWPAAKPGKLAYLEINADTIVKQDFFRGEGLFWDEIYSISKNE